MQALGEEILTTDNTLTYRVSQLEKNQARINDKLDTLLTEEIPTIKACIVAVKTRINVLTAVNVGAILIAILVSKFL